MQSSPDNNSRGGPELCLEPRVVKFITWLPLDKTQSMTVFIEEGGGAKRQGTAGLETTDNTEDLQNKESLQP